MIYYISLCDIRWERLRFLHFWLWCFLFGGCARGLRQRCGFWSHWLGIYITCSGGTRGGAWGWRRRWRWFQIFIALEIWKIHKEFGLIYKFYPANKILTLYREAYLVYGESGPVTFAFVWTGSSVMEALDSSEIMLLEAAGSDFSGAIDSCFHNRTRIKLISKLLAIISQ